MASHNPSEEEAGPEYRGDALLRHWSRSGTPVLRAMRTGLFRERDEADAALDGLARTFGTNPRNHCFDAEPLRWLHLREPQVTAGLAHFLSAKGAAIATRRRVAFLEAAFAASGRSDLRDLLDGATIAAGRAVAEEARVDLLVEADLVAGGRIGVVVEAKFGHHLTRGQLPKARRHAASRGLDPACSAFLFVLPSMEDIGTRVFSRTGNRDWIGVTWFDLLVWIERRLPPEADDEAFRTFRRTIWWMTYG